MHNEKLSISLPISLAHFINKYQVTHACKTRSEVIQEAVKLLQEKELQHYYREASHEVDPLFECTAADGLDDEAW